MSQQLVPKRNKLKHFVRISAIYFIGNVLIKFISLLLLPLYTKYLHESDLGYNDTVVSALQLIVTLLAVEIWSAILRFTLDYGTDNTAEKWRVISTGMRFFLLSAGLLLGVGFAVFPFVDLQHKWLILVLGLGLMLQSVFSGIARSLERNLLFMLSGVCGSILTLLLNYILIRRLGLGVEALFIAAASGYYLQSLIVFFGVAFPKHFRWQAYDCSLLRNMLKFSWPLCVNTLSYWLLTGYAKIAIAAVAGLEQAGIFAVATRFSQILLLVTTIFNLSWQEVAFASGKDDDRRATYSGGFNLYARLLGMGVLVLIPITKLIFPLMVVNDGFAPALELVPLYYVSTLFSALTGFTGSVFGAEKKTHFVFLTTVIGGLTNIVLLHILLPSIGLIGAPIALTIGFGVIIAVRLFLLVRRGLMNISYFQIIALAVALAAVTVVTIRFDGVVLYVLTGVLTVLGFAVFTPLVLRLLRKRGKPGYENPTL